MYLANVAFGPTHITLNPPRAVGLSPHDRATLRPSGEMGTSARTCEEYLKAVRLTGIFAESETVKGRPRAAVAESSITHDRLVPQGLSVLL